MDYYRETYIPGVSIYPGGSPYLPTTPGRTIIEEEHSTSGKTALSYQVKLGTTLVLTDGFDLDFHIKYQNLGPTGEISAQHLACLETCRT